MYTILIIRINAVNLSLDMILAGSKPFADLLTWEPVYGSSLYEKWKDAFPLAYGHTVEETAKKYRDKDLFADIF